MTFSYSTFAQKFQKDSAVVQLMDDLGDLTLEAGYLTLGGGNPSEIPEMQTVFQTEMAALLENQTEFDMMLSRYTGAAGIQSFRETVAGYLKRECGWAVGPENIAITNGSQTAFFYLFNAFAGEFSNGDQKKILFPMAPEYVGYTEAGLSKEIFVSYKPEIRIQENGFYKYFVDFDALDVDDTIGAICVSRPTNPTGNVLEDEEMAQLSALAKEYGIPLIVDNAYGAPFPGIIFEDVDPIWEPHMIMCLSMSKLGLPGTRTGILVAHEDIIRLIEGMNAVISLAPTNFGAVLANRMIATDAISRLSETVIKPHYTNKVQTAIQLLRAELDDSMLRIHKPEGAIFLWLWFPNLPISSQELYERLKARKVIVLPGHHFYPGLEEDWQHKHECIRMSYAGPAEIVAEGIKIIGEEVRKAFAG